MIVNIRGTNGSGKSYVVRSLLNELGKDEFVDEEYQKWMTKIPDREIFVIGKYTKEAVGGGVDNYVKQMDILEQLVRKYNELGTVIFEGIFCSTSYQRWFDLFEKVGRDRVVWFYMATPLYVCLERVEQRRHKSLTSNNIFTITNNFNNIMRQRVKLNALEYDYYLLDGENVYSSFRNVLFNRGVL